MFKPQVDQTMQVTLGKTLAINRVFSRFMSPVTIGPRVYKPTIDLHVVDFMVNVGYEHHFLKNQVFHDDLHSFQPLNAMFI